MTELQLADVTGSEQLGAALARSIPWSAGRALTLFLTGELGTGTRMKLCNNAMTYVTLRAAFEACRLAQGAGLSIALVEEITQASGVLSDRMRSYLGSLKLPPEVVAMEAVQARLAHYVTVADKDLEIALELARDLGIDLPVTRSCAEGTAELYRQTPAGQGSSS